MLALVCRLGLLAVVYVGASCFRRGNCSGPVPLPYETERMGALELMQSDSMRSDSLVGVVVSQQTERPILNADVTINTRKPVATDEGGRFAVPFPTGREAIVRVRAIGYQFRWDTLDVAALRGRQPRFELAYARTGPSVVVCK